jgi:DNA-binding transcriptional ArsR family regulator
MSRRADAAAFAALGDETRLGIVARLCGSGPASIASLTERSGVTRQAVAKHLRVLEDAGLVRTTRAGRESRWHVLQGGLDDARRTLDRISEQWDAALGRLREHVENRSGK